MSAKRSGSIEGRTQRQLRMGEVIRRALSEIFLRDHIVDTRLEGTTITITEVRVSPDLRSVTAFVLPLGGENQDEVVAALNENKKYLRGQVSRVVSIRYTPTLKFELDTSFDNFSRIDNILHSPKVARDLEKRDEDEGLSGTD